MVIPISMCVCASKHSINVWKCQRKHSKSSNRLHLFFLFWYVEWNLFYKHYANKMLSSTLIIYIHVYLLVSGNEIKTATCKINKSIQLPYWLMMIFYNNSTIYYLAYIDILILIHRFICKNSTTSPIDGDILL